MKFVLGRILAMIPTVWAIVTITFFIIRLAPGGPFMSEREIPAEARRAKVGSTLRISPLSQNLFPKVFSRNYSLEMEKREISGSSSGEIRDHAPNNGLAWDRAQATKTHRRFDALERCPPLGNSALLSPSP